MRMTKRLCEKKYLISSAVGDWDVFEGLEIERTSMGVKKVLMSIEIPCSNMGNGCVGGARRAWVNRPLSSGV